MTKILGMFIGLRFFDIFSLEGGCSFIGAKHVGVGLIDGLFENDWLFLMKLS